MFRGVEDPDMVTIVMEFTDLAKAKAFSASDDLKNAMKAAGRGQARNLPDDLRGSRRV